MHVCIGLVFFFSFGRFGCHSSRIVCAPLPLKFKQSSNPPMHSFSLPHTLSFPSPLARIRNPKVPNNECGNIRVCSACTLPQFGIIAFWTLEIVRCLQLIHLLFPSDLFYFCLHENNNSNNNKKITRYQTFVFINAINLPINSREREREKSNNSVAWTRHNNLFMLHCVSFTFSVILQFELVNVDAYHL